MQGKGFWVGVQALLLLAETETSTSTVLAQVLSTHAVDIRRMMARFAQAGLVQARVGREGGYRLAQSATQITLADVYQATAILPQKDDEHEGIRATNASAQLVLKQVQHELEQRHLEALRQYSIASLLQRKIDVCLYIQAKATKKGSL